MEGYLAGGSLRDLIRGLLMRPLLLHGFGTSVWVNGRVLELDWRPEGRREPYRHQQLPVDSIVVDLLSGSVCFEALPCVGGNEISALLLR